MIFYQQTNKLFLSVSSYVLAYTVPTWQQMYMQFVIKDIIKNKYKCRFAFGDNRKRSVDNDIMR